MLKNKNFTFFSNFPLLESEIRVYKTGDRYGQGMMTPETQLANWSFVATPGAARTGEKQHFTEHSLRNSLEQNFTHKQQKYFFPSMFIPSIRYNTDNSNKKSTCELLFRQRN